MIIAIATYRLLNAQSPVVSNHIKVFFYNFVAAYWSATILA